MVTPSPVFDLLFACYYLKGVERGTRAPLPWAADLREKDPQLVRDAARLIGQDQRPNTLFAMALELGYYGDSEPGRFIADLPRLPGMMREVFPGRQSDSDECRAESRAGITPDDLPDQGWITNAQDVLRRLWSELSAVWHDRGQAAAQAAAEEVRARLAESDDVLLALPRRHFGQFENLAANLREAFSRGRLLVVPLAFAEGGGFHLDGEQLEAVGFGLHGDEMFESLESEVALASAVAKSLADPTRMMLLALVVKFGSMSMTVTDLARQLGVSQPTVSGHLKQLREAGLVVMERKGNSTYPKADEEALSRALAAIGKVFERH